MCTSSDSDSDCELRSSSAVIGRYNTAGFSAALLDSYNFKRASEELSDIWHRVSAVRDPKSRKFLQDMLIRDTLMAVSQCDGTIRNRGACERLAAAAVKALPQGKKRHLQRFIRAQSISAAKEHKRATRVCDTVDEQAWTDFAPELLAAVFDRLDPCSLGVAACICKDWHTEARKESRWMLIYEKACGVPGGQETPRSRQQSFKESVRDLVKDRRRQCLNFTSGRRIRCGLLFWLDSAADHASCPPICPTIKEVTDYIFEGRAARVVSGTPSDSSDDEDEHSKKFDRGRLWQRQQRKIQEVLSSRNAYGRVPLVS